MNAPPTASTRPAGLAFKIILLTIMIGALMAVHYMTPATMAHSVLHDVHRQLFYVPIILSAFWFGWRGGLLVALLISALFFPHLVNAAHVSTMPMEHNSASTELINRVFEMIIFVGVGAITGFLVDRLRAEEARLIAAMENLRARTREVFEAEEQLRRADRLSAIGQLTTSLAHEIRNPLASIRGAAEILGDSGVPEPQRVEFSRIMLEETQRLDRVLGNFIDYARSQKNKTGTSTASLPRITEKVAALLGRPLADSRVEFSASIPEDLPLLAIDEDLLQQALINLMLNAIQAMRSGGRLAINAAKVGSMITVRVSDTGPGIPPAAAARVFDPFFTTKPQGLGLGLAIVHKIVTGCGGAIELESSPAGASFKLTLPTA